MAATASAGAVAGIGSAHDPLCEQRSRRRGEWAGLAWPAGPWPRGGGFSFSLVLFSVLPFSFFYVSFSVLVLFLINFSFSKIYT